MLRRGPINIADAGVEVGGEGSDGARLLQAAEGFGSESETFITMVMFNTLSLLQVPNIWTTINIVAEILIRKPTLTSSEVTDICRNFLTDEDCKQAAEHIVVLIMAMQQLAQGATEAKSARRDE